MTELRVDATYRNTNNWRAPADEFGRFFRFADGRGIKNVGGFRAKSRAGGDTHITRCCFCVLITNMGESEWPDQLDRETGALTYYGDNRHPGTAVNATPVGGNLLLEDVFDRLHRGERDAIPPFLCFQSFNAPEGNRMRFLGLAAPGGAGLSALEDLVAVWRVREGMRFQNYKASFSILNAPEVTHAWLEDLVAGTAPVRSPRCPTAWKRWVELGRYDVLRCERRARARSRLEQQPAGPREGAVLSRVYESLSPREFEFAASSLLALMDERFTDLEVTRAARDGGRDVVARYRVGHDLHQVLLSASVEAKRWNPGAAVGVRPMMRLLSRLKHRDLGVFITTSYFEQQVQEELIEDGHPVILVSGGDLARLLVARQIEGPSLERWLAGVKLATMPGSATVVHRDA